MFHYLYKTGSIYRFITVSVKSRTFVLESQGLMNHPLNIFLPKESQQSDHEAEQKHVWSALFNIGAAVAASQITHTHIRTSRSRKYNTRALSTLYSCLIVLCGLEFPLLFHLRRCFMAASEEINEIMTFDSPGLLCFLFLYISPFSLTSLPHTRFFVC